mmetsp:Transcript_116958/g.338057  ORF Transcript_116958/g.338057 Transcript_116958/m.338057 type:complete len:208 (-) Transcript_116958:372-995(-)
MADVGRGQVRRLVPVVVEDVVPVREGHHARGHADARPVPCLHANRLVVLKLATEIHGGNVGLVADDPQCQTRAGVPEALQVEGHLQEAMEEPRVTCDPKEVVVDALAEVKDAPIFLELGVIDMPPPEQAEVDVQPERHELGDDDARGQQRAHVRPDEVWAEVAIPTQGVWDDVGEEEGGEAVHRILELVAILQRDALYNLGGDEDLH